MEGTDVAETLDTLTEQAEAEWFELFTDGPANTRLHELPPQVGDPAPDFELQNQDGEPIRLSEFWEDGPALVLFWRHYGCGCGFERAERLAEEYESYVKAGANVVAIGEGEPARTSAYAAENDIVCPMLCDPDREAYRAYGLRDFQPAEVLHGAADAFFEFDPEAARELAEERRERGDPLVDNPWQQPGEFVINTDGKLELTYRYQYCEDYPESSVLRSAIEHAGP